MCAALHVVKKNTLFTHSDALFCKFHGEKAHQSNLAHLFTIALMVRPAMRLAAAFLWLHE